MVEIGGVDGVTAVPEKASAILPGARLAPDRLCLQCDTLVTHKAELDQLSKAAVSAGRRAVRMVEEHREAHASEWAVLQSVVPKLGCPAETLVRQAQRDAGHRPGLTTSERERLKELEREVRELKRANEILRKASAYFAQAELDRRGK